MPGFDRLLAEAIDIPSILGVILSGSRGRGTGGPRSDWDCYVISDDDRLEESAGFVEQIDDPLLDCSVLGLKAFDGYAAPDSENAWEAYAFVHVTVAYDALDGTIANLAAAKEFLPPTVAARVARSGLDAFINQCVRAAKDRRDGNEHAAVLDHAEAVSAALETIFALEGRVRPYNRYLSWELERHPLRAFTAADLADLVKRLASDDAEAARELFRRLEGVARSKEIGDVIDAWGDRELQLLRSAEGAISRAEPS
jgi:hypothetical protein